MTDYGSSWARTTVGELLRIRYGKALSTEERNPAGPVPVVGSAGRMTGTHTALVTAPAVLVGRKGSAGAVRLELDGCWPIDTTYYAEIPATCDPRFLRWQLHALDLGRLDSSTTTPSLRREDLEAQPMVVPPLDQQRRIVDLLEDHLSRLDAASQAIADSLVRLKALRDAALLSLVGEAKRTGQTETHSLGELARIGSGMTPLKGNKAFYDGGTIPWITSGDLHQGLITKPTQFVTQTALDETSLKIVPAGSLLVAMYGEGKTRGTAAELALDATTNQACAAITLHEPDLRGWVRLILDANYTGLRRLAAGGVQPNLNLSLIKAIEVPVPSAETRHMLISHVALVDEARERMTEELVSAQRRGANLRRSLFTAAFSGRLTGTAPDLSVAEEMITA
jgi:type I restriction enzyme S subunit